MKQNTKKKFVAIAITVLVVSLIGYTLFSRASAPLVISSENLIAESNFLLTA